MSAEARIAVLEQAVKSLQKAYISFFNFLCKNQIPSYNKVVISVLIYCEKINCETANEIAQNIAKFLTGEFEFKIYPYSTQEEKDLRGFFATFRKGAEYEKLVLDGTKDKSDFFFEMIASLLKYDFDILMADYGAKKVTYYYFHDAMTDEKLSKLSAFEEDVEHVEYSIKEYFDSGYLPNIVMKRKQKYGDEIDKLNKKLICRGDSLKSDIYYIIIKVEHQLKKCKKQSCCTLKKIINKHCFDAALCVREVYKLTKIYNATEWKHLCWSVVENVAFSDEEVSAQEKQLSQYSSDECF